MSTRRQAIHPFTFSDGTKLEVGDWACTPLRAMLHDEKHFQQPSQFFGFRFVDKQVLTNLTNSNFGSLESQKPSQLTDVDKHWHVWGTGRMAWYVERNNILELDLSDSQIVPEDTTRLL